MKQTRDEIAKLVGIILAAFLIVVLAWLFIYALLGALTDGGRHLLASLLVFAVPAAYLIGLQVARSYKAGIEKGVDSAVAVHKGVMSYRPAVAASPQTVLDEWSRPGTPALDDIRIRRIDDPDRLLMIEQQFDGVRGAQ